MRPPATEAALCALERAVGVRLPDEVRALYLAHDGIDNPEHASASSSGPSLLPWSQHWLPVHDVFRFWTLDRYGEKPPEYFGYPDTETTDKVKAQNSSRQWIPIGADNTGCCIHVDLDPGPAGRMGQLIFYNRDTGPDRNSVIASSFTAYLQQFAFCLEQDLLEVNQEGWFSRATGKPVYSLWQLTGPDWRPPTV